jgi:undecaprenyl-diphosphatase
MLDEITLAIIQAATEFLPISSSGHLALFGNLFSKVDLFYYTLLHLASLIAIIIFTRKDIYKLIIFDKDYYKLWGYLIIGIIPASLFGLLFYNLIETAFNSLIAISISFFFSGIIITGSKFFQNKKGKLNKNRSLVIGLSQILALFPGVSRSGTTISFGMYSGLKKEEAFKFSFLIAIPLILAAFIKESIPLFFTTNTTFFRTDFLIGFILCFFLSLLFLKILYIIIKKNYFWLFGIYCFLMSIITLLIYLKY